MDKQTGLDKIREIEKQYSKLSQNQEWLQSNIKKYHFNLIALALMFVGCLSFVFSAISKGSLDIFATLCGVASVASLPLMGYNIHKTKGVKNQIQSLQQEKRELLRDKQHVLDNVDIYSSDSYDITIQPKTQTNKVNNQITINDYQPEI